MTAQQLKNSILQMAVQGKLVPQDPNDEPASVLLERIRAEKERLIKEKKIKREKNPSVIFKGADNIPYEKIGDEGRSLAGEVPFEIPDSWEWVRLGSVVYNRGQTSPSTEFCYIDIGSIDNKNQKLNPTDTTIAPDKAPSRARKLVDMGDILYSTVRPYLHNMCIIDREFPHIPIASTGFAVLTCHANLLNKYLFYYLMSPDFDAYANNTDNAKGVAYPAINDDRLYKALIPIPPVAEQHRIVSAIDTVALLIDEHNKHPDSPLMFWCPRTNGYWSPDSLRHLHKQMLAAAGVDESVRFHDLRHTFSTLAIQSGVDAKTVAGMLGHYSAAFTLDTYTHVTEQMKRGAAEKIGVFMNASVNVQVNVVHSPSAVVRGDYESNLANCLNPSNSTDLDPTSQ